MRVHSILVMASLGFGLVMTTGCAELRSEFIPATGAPLAIYDRTTTHTGTRDVAVGHDDIRDRSGRRIGTTTHYQKQNYTYDVRTVYAMQGGSKIDDESFFRITQDIEAVKAYDDYHQAGATKVTVGWVLLSVGLGLVGGAIGTYVWDTPRTDDGERSAFSTAAYIGGATGLLLAAFGGYSLADGYKQASTPEARVIKDPQRMKMDAARYNQSVGQPAATPDDDGDSDDAESKADPSTGWPWNMAQAPSTLVVR
jgi:hypothetical protein